jgi:hypothetical protein
VLDHLLQIAHPTVDHATAGTLELGMVGSAILTTASNIGG